MRQIFKINNKTFVKTFNLRKLLKIAYKIIYNEPK